MADQKGVALTELLVTLCIFSIAMAGIYAIYTTQAKYSTKEFRLAESEVEFGIAKNIIERDIMMAGYGLADDYGSLPMNPLPVMATDAGSLTTFDSISLRGTAIGIFSKSAQGWSYASTASPVTFHAWSDGRENIQSGDKVIYMDSRTKQILTEGTTAIFTFPSAPSAVEKGTLAYGLHSESALVPYYTVEYRLGGTPPSTCASGTLNLLRAESRNADPPPAATREPILNCVRDFQISLGLDTTGDGTIDTWDPVAGAFMINGYDMNTIKRQLKQVRLYILVQAGNRDSDYTYSNPDNPGNPDTIRVGETALGTGRAVKLTADQRKYRWRVVSLNVTPRNLR